MSAPDSIDLTKRVESLEVGVAVIKDAVENHIPSQLDMHFKLLLGLYATVIGAAIATILTRH